MITIKDNREVSFNDIPMGDFFEYNENLYMRIPTLIDDECNSIHYNAICFHKRDRDLSFFLGCEQVMKVNVELILCN